MQTQIEMVVGESCDGYESLCLDLVLSNIERWDDVPDFMIACVGTPQECYNFMQVNNFKREICPFIFLDGKIQTYYGRENPAYHYPIGCRVIATDTAIYVAGTKGIIADYEFYGGYHRYMVKFDCDGKKGSGHYCRHKDIFPV